MHGADEHPLTGGNASSGVVRVGDTVRKPWLPTTERVGDYLRELSDRGIDVPRLRGRDAAGQQILDYVPGGQAIDRSPLDLPTIHRVGALVRSIHDASADLSVPAKWGVLIPADAPDLLCHNDLATWNLIIDAEGRLVFIDWDGAGPSTALWDLAYAALSFGHLFPDADPDASAARLAAFADGYDANDAMRSALPVALARRAAAMHDLLRRSHEARIQPWAGMYLQGHGDFWQAAAQHVADHVDRWGRALRG